ncbi:DUF5819 family protein [Streptomyces zingiberis]|uniref:Uncharacterized protein n=1 Tax=Streptomyces zingiberis TaxID=2053010 RepID=A0ABX1BS51_9ACTN|nr:DUF5819 family protein [Streptomyces zingiberis]NJP99277.1 hypothetical protein [Streptomyces zingiberis]
MEHTEQRGTAPPAGVGALSLPARVAVAVVLGIVTVAALAHLTLVFLHVAPENAVSARHREVVSGYVYPEFEQNWKLFAPNPLQQNVAVQARAEVVARDGGVTVTAWTNLTARDAEAIRHNLFPSHVNQNELRRAWDFFTGSHDERDRPQGPRGALSEEYLRRIVLSRIGPETASTRVRKIQVRSAVTPVPPPVWAPGADGTSGSGDRTDGDRSATGTTYRTLPWWKVTPGDVPGTGGAGRAAVVGGP